MRSVHQHSDGRGARPPTPDHYKPTFFYRKLSQGQHVRNIYVFIEGDGSISSSVMTSSLLLKLLSPCGWLAYYAWPQLFAPTSRALQLLFQDLDGSMSY